MHQNAWHGCILGQNSKIYLSFWIFMRVSLLLEIFTRIPPDGKKHNHPCNVSKHRGVLVNYQKLGVFWYFALYVTWIVFILHLVLTSGRKILSISRKRLEIPQLPISWERSPIPCNRSYVLGYVGKASHLNKDQHCRFFLHKFLFYWHVKEWPCYIEGKKRMGMLVGNLMRYFISHI